MVADGSCYDYQMPVSAFMIADAAAWEEVAEIIGAGPNKFGVIGRKRAGDESDFRSEFETADEWPRGLREKAAFDGADSQRDVSFDGGALGFAGFSVEAGGDIDREGEAAATIDRFDEANPIGRKFAIEADAEQG